MPHFASEDEDTTLTDLVDRMDELLDHVRAILTSVLAYSTKHGLPLDKSLSHHITRIEAILNEIGDSANQYLTKRRNPRDNNLTEPLLDRLIRRMPTL